ncbi:MAG: PIN domain-containing protein [Actinomycetota bacterium]|nr:PIN domain-containing protein [Actinomycetota bacterium]MDQ3733060.1 PIN domain-containing protein [Actinomycetota bacterium]
MRVKSFLDTNVLVYLFDGSDPEKQRRADSVLESHDAARLVVSTQVLGEFYVTVTRKLVPPMDSASAMAAIAWISDYIVVPLDVSMVHKAIETSRTAQLSYWDALIIEAAASAGCDRILTEDLAAGSVLRGVLIDNPFAKDGR